MTVVLLGAEHFKKLPIPLCVAAQRSISWFYLIIFTWSALLKSGRDSSFFLNPCCKVTRVFGFQRSSNLHHPHEPCIPPLAPSCLPSMLCCSHPEHAGTGTDFERSAFV